MSYGIENGIVREPAQVIMHLPENWTRVLFVRTYGEGLADGGIYWDIPTEAIPVELRPIGSRFVVTARVEKSGRFERGRASILNQFIKIERLPENEKLLWPGCNERQ